MLDRGAYYKSLLPNSGLIKEAGLNRGGFARAFLRYCTISGEESKPHRSFIIRVLFLFQSPITKYSLDRVEQNHRLYS